METKTRLETLGNTICNPYEASHVRTQAIGDYAVILKEQAETAELLDLNNLIQTFSHHVVDYFPAIIADSSEKTDLRKNILDLIVTYGIDYIAKTDRKIKEASSNLKTSFNLSWPDPASQMAKEMRFDKTLETLLQVAEDPREPEKLRVSAIFGFNKIAKLANTVFGQDIDRENYNARILIMAMAASGKTLPKLFMNLGYKTSQPNPY